MALGHEGLQCTVVSERCGQVMHPLRQRRLVGVGRLQVLAAVDGVDGRLPRVVGPEPQLACSAHSAKGVAHSLLRGQEHHLVDARHLISHAVVVARSLVADGQPLQVHGVVEHMFADIGGLLGQDDGFQRFAVVEHILIHHVVLVDEVVDAMTLVGVYLVLLQARVIQIQVAQLSIGGIAVVHVGTGQEAQHAHVDTVQRTTHGQRVDVPVGSLQTFQVVAVHHSLQAKLRGQFAHLGSGHLLREGLCVTGSHDVVLIVTPFLLVGSDRLSRHINLETVGHYFGRP